MALVQFTLPASAGLAINQERLTEYLADNGVVSVQGVMMPGDGTFWVDLADLGEAVEVETLIATFQNAPTRREQFEDELKADAVQLLQQIKNKGKNNWTNNEKIILAFALELQSMRQGTE